MWPFTKKKVVVPDKTSIRPSPETLEKLASGELDLFSEYLCYQHVNWAYEYLGSNVKVHAYDKVLNGHVVVITGAAVKYLEDIAV